MMICDRCGKEAVFHDRYVPIKGVDGAHILVDLCAECNCHLNSVLGMFLVNLEQDMTAWKPSKALLNELGFKEAERE